MTRSDSEAMDRRIGCAAVTSSDVEVRVRPRCELRASSVRNVAGRLPVRIRVHGRTFQWAARVDSSKVRTLEVCATTSNTLVRMRGCLVLGLGVNAVNVASGSQIARLQRRIGSLDQPAQRSTRSVSVRTMQADANFAINGRQGHAESRESQEIQTPGHGPISTNAVLVYAGMPRAAPRFSGRRELTPHPKTSHSAAPLEPLVRVQGMPRTRTQHRGTRTRTRTR